MALLTHKVSSCTDNYSRFAKEKTFYGIPYLDRSRSSIPSDASSFFGGAISLRDSAPDLSLIPPRSGGGGKSSSARIVPAPNQDAVLPCKIIEPARATVLQIVEPASRSNGDDNGALPDFEDVREGEGEEVEEGKGEEEGGEEEEEEVKTGFNCGTFFHSNILDSSASFVTAESEHVPGITGEEGETEEQGKAPYVFHRWMGTMFRRNPLRVSPVVIPTPPSSAQPSVKSFGTGRSSSLFVSEVRTASITLASFSTTSQTAGGRKADVGDLDSNTVNRMLDRKHALEELISTEEYYIRDLKSLKDKYLPILRDCVWISSDTRQAMARNVTEMLELHGRLLADIARALPCTTQTIQGHHGNHNLVDMTNFPILSEPAAAAEVAKIFDTTIMAFFVYEEYSAKYQEVIRAPKRTSKPSDTLHGKGTEALIGVSNSWDNRGDYGKRAMELYDLLFKPIQRLCKYPLLFRDIEKNTPAIDCPDTNRLLEKVRHRLDEAVHQVNVANSDAPKVRERIEKTWLLQDRLDFQQKSLPVRLLGHVILCGTLHVTWQSNIRESQPHTEYMACLLFKSYLILASVSKHDHYKVKFAVTLAIARIEEPSHGKGLYSPGAPHTWKVVFEADHRIYEVLLSACSDDEESVWRSQIQDRIMAESKDYQEYCSTGTDFCSCISSDIKPVGDVFGRPGTLARHQSLLRGGLSSSLESDGQYLVINNFLFAEDPHGSTSVRRTYSALNFNGLVPTVNLKRTERNRAEARLADVWTKDLIPFNATRTKVQKEPNSATIIRRLSVLSMLSGGSKRPALTIDPDTSDTPWEDDYDYDEPTAKRSSTLSFTRSKSSSYATAPSSPTKRSSSLSSKFSFNSSTKKENTSGGSSPTRRRGIIPLLDGKWRSTDETITEATSAELDAAGYPEQWTGEEGYVSIVKPATPSNSVQEDEEITVYAALQDSYMRSRAGASVALNRAGTGMQPPGASFKTTEPKISRRHTTVAPSPSHSPPKSWRSVKRAKARNEPFFAAKLSGGSTTRR